MQVPSRVFEMASVFATAEKSDVQVNAKRSSSFDFSFAMAAASCLSLFFLDFCLGPCPSFSPPFAQQSALMWLFLLQLSQCRLELGLGFFFAFLLPFPRAISADSAALVCSVSITQCCNSSVKNAMRLAGVILGWLAVPCVAPSLSAAVMVCIADQYNGGIMTCSFCLMTT